MFSADPYVVEFIKGNFISLTMALTFLKGLAVLTKSVHDDKIVTLLQKVFRLGGKEIIKDPEVDTQKEV